MGIFTSKTVISSDFTDIKQAPALTRRKMTHSDQYYVSQKIFL